MKKYLKGGTGCCRVLDAAPKLLFRKLNRSPVVGGKETSTALSIRRHIYKYEI